MQYKKSLVWFRRDLRNYDHAALYHALKNTKQVYCAFVFDTDILDLLKNKADRRVEFIWECLKELKQALQSKGSDLIVKHGSAINCVTQLASDLNVDAVFTNHDYEPIALKRDEQVQNTLKQNGIAFHSYKDQVIFEKNEILNKSNKPYLVYTPYRNAVMQKLDDYYLQPYPVDQYISNLAKVSPSDLLPLETLGFKRTNLKDLKLPIGMTGGKHLLDDFINRMHQYKEARNYPSVRGVSYLSTHLRFGTVSIRHLASTAYRMENAGAETWLNELIWRDFYFQILHHHPQVAAGHTFNPAFDDIQFPNDKTLFEAWCEARTGYPLIDAAMRQINQTGYMHNRLRMIVASFLVKDLLIDWRWGEQYFAEHLIDYDFSANNGGWQWAASTGCDAQPWFRIFNPVTQSERFDKNGKFIKKYLPELSQCTDKEIHQPWQISSTRQQEIGLIIGENYPAPIVDHAHQRILALDLYKQSNEKSR
ncbi:MAG: cryptochrome/photolyase family protein [Methylotenera sp.]